MRREGVSETSETGINEGRQRLETWLAPDNVPRRAGLNHVVDKATPRCGKRVGKGVLVLLDTPFQHLKASVAGVGELTVTDRGRLSQATRKAQQGRTSGSFSRR